MNEPLDHSFDRFPLLCKFGEIFQQTQIIRQEQQIFQFLDGRQRPSVTIKLVFFTPSLKADGNGLGNDGGSLSDFRCQRFTCFFGKFCFKKLDGEFVAFLPNDEVAI